MVPNSPWGMSVAGLRPAPRQTFLKESLDQRTLTKIFLRFLEVLKPFAKGFKWGVG
jgi:hypothetical protein